MKLAPLALLLTFLTGLAYGASGDYATTGNIKSRSIELSGTAVTISASKPGSVAQFGNVTARGVSVTGGISATGNVNADKFIGDGSNLTGLPLSGFVSGAAASSQVAYWSSSSTLAGASGFTYSGGLLSTGGISATGTVSGTRFVATATGNTTTPDITWAGDTGSGLTRTAASRIALSLGGTPLANFTTSGLGLNMGNAIPSATLHVSGTAVITSNAEVYGSVSASSALFGNVAASGASIDAINARMQALTVTGTASASTGVFGGVPPSGASLNAVMVSATNINLNQQADGASPRIAARQVSNGRSGGLAIANTSGGPAYLWVDGPGIASLQRGSVNDYQLALLSNGNVGISNSAPLAKLDVNGSISASDVIQAASTTTPCSGGILGGLRYTNTSDTLQVCSTLGWKSLATVEAAGSYQVVSTSLNLLLPSSTTPSRRFKLRGVGGGGSGGGGVGLGQSPGGGGGACFETVITGLGPTSYLSITVGLGGASVSGATAGVNGQSTTVVVMTGASVIASYTAGYGFGGGNGTMSQAGQGGSNVGCASPNCFSRPGGGGGVTGSGPGGYGGDSCMAGNTRETQAGVSPGDTGRGYGGGGAGGANGGTNSSGAGGQGAVIWESLN